MDGFGTNSKVVVFGATNLGSSLDDALVRAGRFDRTDCPPAVPTGRPSAFRPPRSTLRRPACPRRCMAGRK